MSHGTTYHCAASVDIDRFGDARIREVWLPMFRQLGCETPADVREKCAEARRQGLEVFPPCDHTGSNGVCLGHEPDPECAELRTSPHRPQQGRP